MADQTGPPRSKYPPPKPPAPNPPQALQAPPAGSPQQTQPGYPQQRGYPQQQGYPQQWGYAPQPGYGPGAVRAPAQPSAYWPLSIISFICSFLLGAIAVYFSAQVGSRWRAGNIQGAEKASRMALIWGIVVGLIVFFAVIGSGSSSSGY